QGAGSNSFPADLGEINDQGSAPLPATGRFKGQMHSMRSILQHSRGKGGSLRRPTKHRWKTPAPSLWKSDHWTYRPDREETRGPLHARVQNILHRNNRL